MVESIYQIVNEIKQTQKPEEVKSEVKPSVNDTILKLEKKFEELTKRLESPVKPEEVKSEVSVEEKIEKLSSKVEELFNKLDKQNYRTSASEVKTSKTEETNIDDIFNQI